MVHEVDQVVSEAFFGSFRPKSLFHPLTKSDKLSTEGESLSVSRQTLFVESLKNIIREKDCMLSSIDFHHV